MLEKETLDLCFSLKIYLFSLSSTFMDNNSIDREGFRVYTLRKKNSEDGRREMDKNKLNSQKSSYSSRISHETDKHFKVNLIFDLLLQIYITNCFYVDHEIN
jgi:hypothetical protein